MKQRRPWLSLITFCASAAVVVALGLAILFVGASAALALSQSPKTPHGKAAIADRTFSGVMTDSRCGAKHLAGNKGPAECARACVQAGAQYRLVDGDKVYVLSGDAADFDKVAGQRVTVAGSLNGDTIQVSAVN